MIAIIGLVNVIIRIYIWIIIARAVVSWFGLDERNAVVVFLDRLTEPLLRPIRSVVGVSGPVDFSPLIAIALLWAVRIGLNSLLWRMA